MGGQGKREEAERRELLVIPASALDRKGEVGGKSCRKQDERRGAALAGGEDSGEGSGKEELKLNRLVEELGRRQAAEGPVGAAKGGEDVVKVSGGEGLDGDKVGSGGGGEEGRFEQAGPARAGGEQKCELDGHGDQRLVRFKSEAEGGEQGEGNAPGPRKGFAGEVRGSGEQVGEHKQNEDVVALAKVPGRENAGDEEEEKGQQPAVGPGAMPEANKPGAEDGADSGKKGNDELEGDGERKMEGVGKGDDEGGEPEGEGRVGLKDERAVRVGMGADSGGGEQKPELVVAGVRQQGEQDGHSRRTER